MWTIPKHPISGMKEKLEFMRAVKRGTKKSALWHETILLLNAVYTSSEDKGEEAVCSVWKKVRKRWKSSAGSRMHVDNNSDVSGRAEVSNDYGKIDIWKCSRRGAGAAKRQRTRPVSCISWCQLQRWGIWGVFWHCSCHLLLRTRFMCMTASKILLCSDIPSAMPFQHVQQLHVQWMLSGSWCRDHQSDGKGGQQHVYTWSHCH